MGSKGGPLKQLRKRLLRWLTAKLGPPLAAAYIRVVGWTARIRILETERYDEMWKRGPFIIAFWHGKMLGLPPMLPPGETMAVLISQHRDGELITRTIRYFDIDAVRGSSTRGARGAVEEMVRRLHDGWNLAITPDGPRGPAEVAAPGAVRVAAVAGVPIVPVSYAARPGKILPSWDGFVLPAPFSQIVYAVEPDLRVPSTATNDEIDSLTEELARRLTRAGRRATGALDDGDDPLVNPRPPRGGRVASWAYDAALLAGLLMLTPLWLYRLLTTPEVRQRLGERWAIYPRALTARLRAGPRPVWIHAVSVGEVSAILPLVRALASGQGGVEPVRIVLSTVTVTGNATARAKAPPGTEVLYLPLDLSWAVRRAIREIRPRLFVSTESEIWPGLLRELERVLVPAAIANGRVSERTARRYRWVGWSLRAALGRIRLFGMQNEVFRQRVIGMGASPEQTQVLGNLKFDVEVEALDESGREQLRASLGLNGCEWVLVAGSTHEGEEEAALDALVAVTRYGIRAGLVLAPRHPERFESVATLLDSSGLSYRRNSTNVGASGAAVAVHFLDTIGQLAQVYAAGDVGFVGGTLAPVGGHNLLEPAAHGLPVVFGPHTESCQDLADALIQAGAAQRVEDRPGLVASCVVLAQERERARRMGEAGRALVRAHRGATLRTVAALREILADRPRESPYRAELAPD